MAQKRLFALKMFNKKSNEEIACELNISESIVAYWRKEYENKKINNAATMKERKCLSCGKTFLSSGPENRICPSCKEKNVYISLPEYMIYGV